MAKKLAELTKKNLSKLPKECWSILNSSGELIMIVAGENCYRKINLSSAKEVLEIYKCEDYDELADALNAQAKITIQQRAAMDWGSLFGWYTAGANPEFYDEQGKPLNTEVNGNS